MPIDETNCVELALDALRLKFGRNLRERLKAPKAETIDRYIRACRKHDRLPELISEIARLDLLSAIPTCVLFSRPYTSIKRIVAEHAENIGVALDASPLQCPFTIDLFNQDPNYELNFSEEAVIATPGTNDRDQSPRSTVHAKVPVIHFKFES